MASESPTTSPESALGARFAGWRASGHRALIPFLTAGYPSLSETAVLLDRFAAAGADVIEVGVPFSDPLADGPTIQRASQRALEAGVDMHSVLDVVAAFRARSDTAVVLFSYLNPILAYGVDAFLGAASAAGAEGLLLTDLPLDSDAELEATLERSPLALVRLIAPTTPLPRARAIARRSQGFVYYVSRTGVTGANDALRRDLATELAELRAATTVPVAVGFGISTPAQAAAVAAMADGIVVGSALIDAIDAGGVDAATRLLEDMRRAIDRA
jgi:tryptophan synthase alpha chain